MPSELSHEGLLTASEMVGEPMDWEIGETISVIRRQAYFLDHGERRYTVLVDGAEIQADCLNIGGSACALGEASELEFGGDRPKRVTVTENADEKYAYIEVMDR